MIRYIMIINIITFFVYGIDKYLAYKEKSRVSEKLLLTLALCFGIIGALLGMKIFRHKTKKKSLKTSIILIIIIQVVTVYFLTLNKNVLDEIIRVVGIW